MSYIPTIGDVVREFRQDRQISLTDFSRRTGLSKGYISGLEHNKIDNPKPIKLKRLAAVLEITELDILSRRMPGEVKNGNVCGEDVQGSALVEVDGGETPGGMQPPPGQPPEKASAPSTRLNTPLSVHKEILMKRLGELEKALHNAHEEVREIGALIARMQA